MVTKYPESHNCAILSQYESFLLPKNVDKCPRVLKRLHLATNSGGDQEGLIRELERCKSSRRFITEGVRIIARDKSEDPRETHVSGIHDKYTLCNCKDSNYVEYVAAKCDPDGGYIGDETVFYTDVHVPPLDCLELLWDVENETYLRRFVEFFLGISYTHVATMNFLLKGCPVYGPFHVSANSGSFMGGIERVEKTIFFKRLEERNTNHVEDYNILQDETRRMLFERMFNDFLSDYLASNFRIFYVGQSLLAKDLRFFVSGTDPCERPGFVNSQTEIYLGFDSIGSFISVSVAPLYDTIPTTYSFDLLKDYLEPFFGKSTLRIFRLNDVFRFCGVQFRIVGFERRDKENENIIQRISSIITTQSPSSVSDCGRVSAKTHIIVAEPVKPCLTDLIPPECLAELRKVAPSQRESLLLHFASQLDEESLLRLHGISNRNIYDMKELETSSNSRNLKKGIEEIKGVTGCRAYTDGKSSHPQICIPKISANFETFTCTVCCEDDTDIGDSSRIFTYPCGHKFHRHCVGGWVRREGSFCPNCRQYCDFEDPSKKSCCSDQSQEYLELYTTLSADETDLSDVESTSENTISHSHFDRYYLTDGSEVVTDFEDGSGRCLQA